LTIKLYNPPTVTQTMSIYSKEAGASQVPLLYVGAGSAAEVEATTGSSGNMVAASFAVIAFLAMLAL
jgi:hypothetical protein